MSLDDLLKDGRIKLGSDEQFQFSRLSTGMEALDQLLGGGIPKKRITLITGQPNTGKSYLASQVVAQTQKAGGLAAWIDAELSWDATWMVKCGVDVNAIYVSQPETGEAAFDVIRELMRLGVDVIVLDSIASLVPSVMNDEDFSYNPMAWQARMVNSAFPRLMNQLQYGSALIAINQVRSGVGPVAYENTPGGVAQQFFAHFILTVKRMGWIVEQNTTVGFDMEVRCKKSKVGGEIYKECILPFRLDGGVDVMEVSVREALKRELISHSGAWYKFGEHKMLGMNGMRKFFKANPEEFSALLEMLK